jgi:hypothetical protein
MYGYFTHGTDPPPRPYSSGFLSLPNRLRRLPWLFSTFASGWPGVGLLLLRVLTGAALVHFGIANLLEAPPLMTAVLQIIGAVAGTNIAFPGTSLVLGLPETWGRRRSG